MPWTYSGYESPDRESACYGDYGIDYICPSTGQVHHRKLSIFESTDDRSDAQFCEELAHSIAAFLNQKELTR